MLPTAVEAQIYCRVDLWSVLNLHRLEPRRLHRQDHCRCCGEFGGYWRIELCQLMAMGRARHQLVTRSVPVDPIGVSESA